MHFLRTALLTGAAVAFCGLAAAQLVPGGDPPPEVAPPPPPPVSPTPPPPPAGGLVTKVSLADIKAIFTEAGVPFEIARTNSGREIVVGKPNGWVMSVLVMECSDEAAQTGCEALMMVSGTFVKPASLDLANEYNLKNVISHAVIVEGNKSFTKQVMTLNAGIAPGFLRDSFRIFVAEMAHYAEMIERQGSTSSGTGGGTFSANALGAEGLQTVTPTQFVEDGGTAGHAAGGAFGK